MAKSKLMAAVASALDTVEERLQMIKAQIKSGQNIDTSWLPVLQRDLADLDAATGAMETHFKNLAKRENNPSAAEKLKNLKNLFKDKAALAAQRKAAEGNFTGNIKPHIAEAKAKAQKVIQKLKDERAYWEQLSAKLLQ
jgi:hypothetical protein